MEHSAAMNHTDDDIETDTLWQKTGWIAKVIKNDDDDGWAVAMIRVGDAEPALVGPWTMGRDKKNPKPLSQKDFNTLVKTAKEVLDRHEQHARALVHKSVTFLDEAGRRIRVDLDLSADEEDPRPTFTCFDDRTGELLSSGRTEPQFKLTVASAMRLADSGS
jgi:hypothetical protein